MSADAAPKVDVNRNANLKKDIKFNTKFLTKKIDLDLDMPPKEVSKPKLTALEKVAKLSVSKQTNPFGIPQKGGAKIVDKEVET
jgi:hypothetical protein